MSLINNKILKSGFSIASVLVLLGCGQPAPPPTQPIELNLTLSAPATVDPSSTAYVRVFHTWYDEGEMRFPHEEITRFETQLGTTSHSIDYPLGTLGEGLSVFAWVDADGDGVNCTPTVRGDLGDFAEFEGFPADSVSASLFLEVPCTSPGWFFPGPVPDST